MSRNKYPAMRFHPSDAIRTRIKAAAQHRGMTITDLILTAIEQYLSTPQETKTDDN